ncbi:hypothetical protein HELRODRAFT_194540 [Helobdella robusta]|uniref:LIM zinc-binding domain-containing protein n=1 Tax=Helobdella robusta TaxID=6412 RepID=T1FW64_HELRO|nr:hypothetical protein HELRODRAFT_194540 [Helobdella robusta]ESN91148.1 hypothetical protein HELRODRAFT_194540 [Helobdella robusta]
MAMSTSETESHHTPTSLIKLFSKNDQNNNNFGNKFSSSNNNNFNNNNNNIKSPNKFSNGNNNNFNFSNTSENCAHCDERVYQVEKIGPVNGVTFHKKCFKCCLCSQMFLNFHPSDKCFSNSFQILSLKTYFTNPIDSNDRKLYCSKDCPKLPPTNFDASAVNIRAAMLAPARGVKASGDVIRWYGDVPKIGADALHIREAIQAQSEFDRKYLLNNRHQFPAWIKTRGKLLKYQEELERKQRAEEDELVRAFHDERIKEAENVELEIKQEWESNLKKLLEQNKMKRKESMTYERDVDDLKKTLNKKRHSRYEALTTKLQAKAQERTATMVKKHSEEMLTLLKVKQMELKKEIVTELTNEDDEQMFSDALSVMTLPSEIPGPHPPRYRKRDLYKDPSVFADLDEEVFKVAETEQCTFTDLVDQLTANCVTDLEKARAIFRWITVKDLNVMEFSETVKQDTPLGLLRGIKYGTETYHTLFMRLCSYAGLLCKEVKGHSKSVGYEPGMKVRPEIFLNVWNVVLINGDWRPVQCNWGARHLVMHRDPQQQQRQQQQQKQTTKLRDKIRYEYDEHYFLTDPDEFIMEFWSLDRDWQLLENPITLEDFENMPFVRSVFFHHGLEFGESSKKAVLETDQSGGVEIKINMPSELKDELIFHYHLRFADRSKRKETHYNGVDMERYVFHIINDQLSLFSVHVPAVGEYFLEIFANRYDESCFKSNDNDPHYENTEPNQPFKLKCAAKFKIICSKITSKVYPLPSCAPGEWGPVKAQRHFGIINIGNPVGVLNLTEKVTLKFQLQKWMRILAKLRYNGVDKNALEKFINFTINDEKIAIINVTFPQKGQYGIDLYANADNPDDPNASLTHVCKYLVNCTFVSNPVALPQIQRSESISDSVRTDSHRTNISNGTEPHKSNNSTLIYENDYTMPGGITENLPTVIRHQSLHMPDERLMSVRGQRLPNPYEQRQSNHSQTHDQGSTNSHEPKRSSKPIINPLPEPPNLGPTPAFNFYSLKTLSHKSAEIEKIDKNGNVSVEISRPGPNVKLLPKLILEPGKDCTHLVSVKDAPKKCKFSMTLPRYGQYWLTIWATNEKELNSRISEVFTYSLRFAQFESIKNKSSLNKKI